jgi:hypothetical protein
LRIVDFQRRLSGPISFLQGNNMCCPLLPTR